MSVVKKNKSDYFSKEAWRYFLKYFKGSNGKLIATSLGSTLQALLILPILFLVKYIFDVSIPEKETSHLLYIGLAMISLRLISLGLNLFLKKINLNVISSVIYDLRYSLLLKIYSLSQSYYSRTSTQIMHARVVQDTERILNMTNSLITSIVPSIFISICLCAILIFLNWYLFLIMMFFFPVIFFLNKYLGKRLKKRVFVFQRAFEKFSSSTMFLLKFINLIKAQTAKNQENIKQEEVIDELRDKSSKMIYFFALNGQWQSFLVSVSSIIVLVVGGYSVIEGTMTIGDFFAFYMASGFLNNYIKNMTDSFSLILAGNESLVTLHGINSLDEEEPYKGEVKPDFKGQILVENVSFSYNSTNVLNNLNLSLEAGEKIAVIGANGSGKSTLINLILGFYAPQSGNIMADQIDFSLIDFEYFRKSLGVVSQYPPFFTGTIKENISYGFESILDKQIEEVLDLTCSNEFIAKLEQGYNTEIGEDGILLSGGERQRIAIARALLRKPKLLILDEPTNHLDNKIVGQIMRNISTIDYNPTILIVSHDIEVVNHADKIFILEDGRLNPFVKNPN